jgi:hypothetical protein
MRCFRAPKMGEIVDIMIVVAFVDGCVMVA